MTISKIGRAGSNPAEGTITKLWDVDERSIDEILIPKFSIDESYSNWVANIYREYTNKVMTVPILIPFNRIDKFIIELVREEI
jgi:hypothetical protein